jgi:hypothetical protein
MFIGRYGREVNMEGNIRGKEVVGTKGTRSIIGIKWEMGK